jgi:Replication protein A OB domain
MDDDVLRKQPVIAFKGVKVSDYNGCSLSTFNSSNVAVAPDMPETRELESWWTRCVTTFCFVALLLCALHACKYVC